MKCNYVFVHGRQSTRSRGDYGLIELLVSFENGKKTYLSTKTYCKFTDWHKTSRSVKPSSDDFSYVTPRLDYFIADVKTSENDCKMSGREWNPSELKRRRSSVVIADGDSGTLNLAIHRIILGERRKSQGTIDNYNQALDKLNEFDPAIPLAVLNKPFKMVSDLDTFLFDKGLAPTTIDKIHSIFRSLFSNVYKTYFRPGEDNYIDPYETWEFSGNTKDNIFLTDKDIKKIEAISFDFGTAQDLVRDAFLLAYYTGVRYSDMDKLVHDNILDIDGRQVFSFLPKKSTTFNKKPKRAIVPITNNIRYILDKYNWVFPTPGEYLLRKHVRYVCACAGLAFDFKYIKYEGQDAKEIIVPAYKRITMHTARRSAINNMYKAGIPTNIIMRLTGHKSETSLLAYINADTREDAEIQTLLNSKYFN